MDPKNVIYKILQIPKINEIMYFKLNLNIDMNSKNMQKFVYNLNQMPNISAYYNPRTKLCNNISVIDINNNRFIDFDDEYWELINKGIDINTKKTIYD